MAHEVILYHVNPMPYYIGLDRTVSRPYASIRED